MQTTIEREYETFAEMFLENPQEDQRENYNERILHYSDGSRTPLSEMETWCTWRGEWTVDDFDPI